MFTVTRTAVPPPTLRESPLEARPNWDQLPVPNRERLMVLLSGLVERHLPGPPKPTEAEHEPQPDPSG